MGFRSRRSARTEEASNGRQTAKVNIASDYRKQDRGAPVEGGYNCYPIPMKSALYHRWPVVSPVVVLTLMMMDCSQSPPLQSEARRIAQQFIDKKYIPCGNFTIYSDEIFYGGHFGPQDLTQLTEMKGATFGIQSAPLSAADELNGLESNVFVTMAKAAPYRHRRRSNGVWGEWDEWAGGGDGEPVVLQQFVKKNGQWFFVTSTNGTYTALAAALGAIVSPLCSDAN